MKIHFSSLWKKEENRPWSVLSFLKWLQKGTSDKKVRQFSSPKLDPSCVMHDRLDHELLKLFNFR